jgi:thymidylate synthase
MKTFVNFNDAINWTSKTMYNTCHEVHTEKWQGKDIKDDEKYTMIEVLNHSFSCSIHEDIEELKKQIRPNTEWADEHFKERVSGMPLNPPPSHVRWPYAQKNNSEFGGLEKFSHTYPERIWPKYGEEMSINWVKGIPLEGMRYRYGDFNSVVDLMKREPFTRQAFLPIWFPEDTGAVEGQRVPCTLGYQFIRRFEWVHVVYYIRSCDFFRHFRDDIYLCARKLMWLIEELRKKDYENWKDVRPGTLTIHICSLHAWKQEKPLLIKIK